MSRRVVITFLSILLLTILFFLHSGTIKGAADHVVISEIQTAGATGDDEFVELFNPTDQNISLLGWKLKRMTSTGITSETNLVGAFEDKNIPAHGFFLITPPTGFDGGIVPDATYSNTTNRIAGNNTVSLYDNSSVLIDRVGFGTASVFENTVFPTNPAANGSLERISNTDTDNNSVDFHLREVSDPQNSSYIEPTTTPSSSPTETPTPTESPTASPTESPTTTPTPSSTPTATPTSTPTILPTASPTPSPSSSPSASPSPTPTPTGLQCFQNGNIVICRNPSFPSFFYMFLKFFTPPRLRCDVKTVEINTGFIHIKYEVPTSCKLVQSST